MPGEIEKTNLNVSFELSHVYDENVDPYEIDFKIQPAISHFVENTGGGGGAGVSTFCVSANCTRQCR